MVFDLKVRKDIGLTQSRVSLRPLVESDFRNVCRWLESSYILQYSFVVSAKKSLPRDFSTVDYGLRYFNMILKDPNRVSFAIMFEGQHVGNVGLKEINRQELTAECFIEIGESKHRSHGLGKSAMIQILNLAYFDFGLKEVELDVLEFNLAAIKVYGYLGFTTTGFNGWHYDEYGQYWRVIRMSLNKESWKFIND